MNKKDIRRCSLEYNVPEERVREDCEFYRKGRFSLQPLKRRINENPVSGNPNVNTCYLADVVSIVLDNKGLLARIKEFFAA